MTAPGISAPTGIVFACTGSDVIRWAWHPLQLLRDNPYSDAYNGDGASMGLITSLPTAMATPFTVQHAIHMYSTAYTSYTAHKPVQPP